MKLLYHHAIKVSDLVFGIIHPSEKFSCSDFIPAYRWFEKQCGFYPIFLAVGYSVESIRMTGYQNNWLKEDVIHDKDLVCFSFQDVNGVFTDYDYWHIPLGQGWDGKEVKTTKQENRWIFKKSWSKSKWIRNANKKPHTVQICVPELDLRQAARIWVKDKETQDKVAGMGFKNVIIKKIAITGKG